MAVSRKSLSFVTIVVVGIVIYWVLANFVIRRLPIPRQLLLRPRVSVPGRLHDKDHELSTTAAVGSQGGGPYDAASNDRIQLQAAGAGHSTPAPTSADLPLHGTSVAYAVPASADAFPAPDARETMRRLSSASTAPVSQGGVNLADNSRRLDLTSEALDRLDAVVKAGGDVLGAIAGLVPDVNTGGDAEGAEERVRLSKAGVRRGRGSFADSVGMRGYSADAVSHFAQPSDSTNATSTDRLRSAVGERHSKLLDLGSQLQRNSIPVGQGEARKASELLARLASMSMDPAVKAKLTRELSRYVNSWNLQPGESLSQKHQRATGLAVAEVKPAQGFIANRARLDKDGDLMPVLYPAQYSQAALLQKDRVKTCGANMNQYKHALVHTPQLV